MFMAIFHAKEVAILMGSFFHRYIRDLLLNPPAYETATTIQGDSP